MANIQECISGAKIVVYCNIHILCIEHMHIQIHKIRRLECSGVVVFVKKLSTKVCDDLFCPGSDYQARSKVPSAPQKLPQQSPSSTAK